MGTWLLPLIPADKREEFRRMGDVNRDGYIDSEDVELISAAYGSRPGSTNWNPDADLNGDGRVDLSDMTIAGKNHGKDIFTWRGWPAQIVLEGGIIAGVVVAIAGVGFAAYQLFFAPK
ncbi:MAG: hypothetical protein K6T73_11410 [Candidatus Bathyarchaeota archaeon]|nr:hypothetical protein [Candidatus Bathyarchaeota archaeon]